MKLASTILVIIPRGNISIHYDCINYSLNVYFLAKILPVSARSCSVMFSLPAHYPGIIIRAPKRYIYSSLNRIGILATDLHLFSSAVWEAILWGPIIGGLPYNPGWNGLCEESYWTFNVAPWCRETSLFRLVVCMIVAAIPAGCAVRLLFLHMHCSVLFELWFIYLEMFIDDLLLHTHNSFRVILVIIHNVYLLNVAYHNGCR